MKWFRKRSSEPLDKVTPSWDDPSREYVFPEKDIENILKKVHETQWNEVEKDLSELLQKRMEQVYVGTPEEVIPKILENENYLAEAKIESSKDIENIGNYLTKYSKMDVPKTEAQRLTDELIKADVKDMEDLTEKNNEIVQAMREEGSIFLPPKPKPKIAFDLEEFKAFIEKVIDEHDVYYKGNWVTEESTFNIMEGYVLREDRYGSEEGYNCPKDKDTKILKFEII